MNRWYQFNLRQIMILFALIAGGFGLWREWNASRHMRQLSHAIEDSNLGIEDQRLLNALAWNKSAWDSGLIRNLAGPVVLKRITWSSSFTNSHGEPIRVFLLDSFVRPVADTPIPPTYIATDDNYSLITWSSVAEYSSGVIFADLSKSSNGVILTIISSCNWFHGKGTYKYRLKDKEIIHVGAPVFSQFDSRIPDPGLFPYQKESKEISDAIADEWHW